MIRGVLIELNSDIPVGHQTLLRQVQDALKDACIQARVMSVSFKDPSCESCLKDANTITGCSICGEHLCQDCWNTHTCNPA
jgi:hypothetical protein